MAESAGSESRLLFTGFLLGFLDAHPQRPCQSLEHGGKTGDEVRACPPLGTRLLALAGVSRPRHCERRVVYSDHVFGQYVIFPIRTS